MGAFIGIDEVVCRACLAANADTAAVANQNGREDGGTRQRAAVGEHIDAALVLVGAVWHNAGCRFSSVETIESGFAFHLYVVREKCVFRSEVLAVFQSLEAAAFVHEEMASFLAVHRLLRKTGQQTFHCFGVAAIVVAHVDNHIVSPAIANPLQHIF